MERDPMFTWPGRDLPSATLRQLEDFPHVKKALIEVFDDFSLAVTVARAQLKDSLISPELLLGLMGRIRSRADYFAKRGEIGVEKDSPGKLCSAQWAVQYDLYPGFMATCENTKGHSGEHKHTHFFDDGSSKIFVAGEAGLVQALPSADFVMTRAEERPETEESRVARSAQFCEHANENPGWCRCPSNCYCKTHTCKGR